MSDVLESRRDGRLLCLAMNRPEKRNALNAALCADLNARLVEAEHDPEIGAVMLTGNGKGFSAGMDLDEALTTEAGTLADLHERLFTAYAWLTKPLIAGDPRRGAGGRHGPRGHRPHCCRLRGRDLRLNRNPHRAVAFRHLPRGRCRHG